MRPTVALLLVSLLTPAVARPQQPPTPPETTSAAHAGTPDLGKGAEEVAAQLRQLTESLTDTTAFAALEAEVEADTHRAAERWSETGDLLKPNLRPASLDSLESSWQALRSQLDDVRERVDARARRRTADLETLAKLRESWARALDLAQKAAAPAPVLERARSTVAAIDAVRPAIEQRYARVLVLHDSLSPPLPTGQHPRRAPPGDRAHIRPPAAALVAHRIRGAPAGPRWPGSRRQPGRQDRGPAHLHPGILARAGALWADRARPRAPAPPRPLPDG